VVRGAEALERRVARGECGKRFADRGRELTHREPSP
jgi:hypothetical protein